MKKVKKMGKRILSMVLAAVMIIGLMAQTTVPVFARSLIDSEVALRGAIDDAGNGDIITLAGDIPLTSTLMIDNKNIILDLKGKTLSSSDCLFKISTGGNLEITDTSHGATGKVQKIKSNNRPAIWNYGLFTLTNGTVTSGAEGSQTITNEKNCRVDIAGGTVRAEGSFSSAIYNNGSLYVTGGVISSNYRTIGNNGIVNITDGTISGSDSAIIDYSSGESPVTISGGTIGKVFEKVINLSGNPTVEIRLSYLTSGKVNITGPLTGSEGSIILDIQWLALPPGAIVATAINPDNAVSSKFALKITSGKRLAKSGANIVIEAIPAPDKIIPKSISINTTAPEKGINQSSSVASITDTTAAATWSSDNGYTWAAASGTFAPATVYKTKYVFTANSSYEFDSTMATGDVVVAGNKGKVDSAMVSSVSRTNDTLTTFVTWPATGTEINATFKPGTSTGKVKAMITTLPTDHYVIVINEKNCENRIGDTVPSDAQIYNPKEEIDIISSGALCVPGDRDIETWLSVYDVDINGKIVGLYEKELETAELNFVCPFFGDGTVEHPYQIETVDQLKYMGLFSYNSMEDKPNNFILNKDIDLGIAPYNTGKGWPSIGFAGNFDGNGKTIKNLMVNVPVELEDVTMVGSGLFGLAKDGTIKNLAIINANVNGSSNVGILAGNAWGEHIEKVYVSGAVTGKYYVGGLVGLEAISTRTILDCYSRASVSASGAVGGLVGAVDKSTIKTSYAAGKVSIINPTEDVEEKTGTLYKNLHGGLVGLALESPKIKNIFENNYYDKETTGQSDVTGALSKGTLEMKDKTTYVGFDFNTVWRIDPSVNGGYPYLQGLVPNKEQTAPAGISVTAPTSPTSSDGKITGTVAGMEYKLSTASTWTAITGTSVTGLEAGSYQIRYAEKTGYNVGAVITITIPTYVTPTPKPTTGGGSSGGGSSENKTPPSSTTTPTSSTPSSGAGSIKNVGEIVKDQQTDSSAPATSLNTSTTEFKSNVFTAEELAKIETGENAKVILKVTDIASTVSEADKKLIAQDLKKDATVMYVDLSLYKKIGDGPETKITETKNKISISIEVPAELRSSDVTVSRTYQIVRVHEGVVTVIDGTYDPSTHLFTFETDRFSTYALTFKEANVNGDNLSVVNSFNPLRLTAKAAETSEKLSYTKVSGAYGYLIYGAPCGVKNKLEKLADVSSTVTSYNHKGLKKGTYYKYLVQAYKIVDGKQVVIATSKVIHSITASKSYGNPTKVITKTSAVVLKGNTSKNITSKALLPKGKKSRNHTDILQYETTNEKVAIVTSKGNIKAIGKGSCYIYVYAQNGVYTRIKVTVK